MPKIDLIYLVLPVVVVDVRVSHDEVLDAPLPVTHMHLLLSGRVFNSNTLLLLSRRSLKLSPSESHICPALPGFPLPVTHMHLRSSGHKWVQDPRFMV